MSFGGHFWTIGPHLGGKVRGQLPTLRGRPRPWSVVVEDVHGPTTLRGLLEARSSDTIALLVHGLGGRVDAGYLLRAAAAARDAGIASLRLGLRGASREGEGLYHAGLTADLEAAIGSPELAPYKRIVVVGYSLGGHVTLRLALQPPPRVNAVAAICAPLDLGRSADAIDAPKAWVYRQSVLDSLKEIYRATAAVGPVPTPVDVIEGVNTIREWDRLVVAPRFGFASTRHYYDSQSAGPRLGELEVPSLIVHSDADPMVPTWTVERWIGRVENRAEVVRTPGGGHVGFPRRLDLGLPGGPGVEAQVMTWLLSH